MEVWEARQECDRSGPGRNRAAGQGFGSPPGGGSGLPAPSSGRIHRRLKAPPSPSLKRGNSGTRLPGPGGLKESVLGKCPDRHGVPCKARLAVPSAPIYTPPLPRHSRWPQCEDVQVPHKAPRPGPCHPAQPLSPHAFSSLLGSATPERSRLQNGAWHSPPSAPLPPRPSASPSSPGCHLSFLWGRDAILASHHHRIQATFLCSNRLF